MNQSKYSYYLGLLAAVAAGSKDRSIQVGALIVGPSGEIRSTGYNGFPKGVRDNIDHRYERPHKYQWTVHAERNAIFLAARYGSPTEGCTMFSSFYPCTGCMQAIIQAGIKEVIIPELPQTKDFIARYENELMVSAVMALEAGVSIIEYSG